MEYKLRYYQGDTSSYLTWFFENIERKKQNELIFSFIEKKYKSKCHDQLKIIVLIFLMTTI